ncbi:MULTISPECIES: universal stress protein [Pseudomonas]|uniref:Nucleotide-binding universal stress protein, UspA family n=1 Tax=Pseudomonas poae TaxID=200451 RepID=A0AAP2S4H7_9PSED|nr:MULTISPECIES: universal stress protein [Pseudomonas]ELQ14191.1 universal stress protein family protein [Pseudomonas fluorescens BRIP34879]KTC37295.1 universal stress protein UspA [Pseudomonas sp. ABAC21]AGE25975.1 universal stress protein family protein [Pseudomonas poae RE*1-1-14]KRP54607.1 universal stress protein UspA [Pseudomonas poae]MBC3195726.1 universal stress protein [Pseudomonas poae]
MQAIRSILVIIEPEQADSLALRRARLIAGVTGAHLHLLVCDRRHEHSALLSQLKAGLREDGYSVTTEQAWNDSLHETIIDVQQAEGCGLVIKQHMPDSPLKKALLTPADWKLLRYCPTPVLLVKTSTPWSGGVILAAIDVGNTDSEHRALHDSIIDHGFEIASLAKAQLHVISAHPSPMLAAADPTFQLRETIAARYREQCKAFQAQFDVDDAHLHIEEGPADVLIPFAAHKWQAAVTIIGTVARTGISGALIGNTAEVVLDAVESDVLVLKPQTLMDHLEELAINS